MLIRPLADRLRPTEFDDIAGQKKLFGKNGSLRRMVESGHITNMIFYGPPGTGKTTAANIIAQKSNMVLHKLNATTASISDIKEITSQTDSFLGSGGILLYLDEIQYFNKKQQQTLLEYMEDGRITLIASTTENPFFSIYGAIISRSAVFEFRPVQPKDCVPCLRRALSVLNDENGKNIKCEDDVFEYIAKLCGGDVRHSMGLLEHMYFASDGEITVSLANEFIPEAMRGISTFSKEGDDHYDLLSALQKSIRGSDPDATVFYLARLLCAGELLSVCRRLQVIASEDIGLAYPMAAAIVRACCESALDLGLPEARIPLANAAVTLATAPKSVTALEALDLAMEDVKAGRGKDIPAHLRDSHYEGASTLGHGTSYKYPHAYKNDYVAQRYLPEDVANRQYYKYGTNKTEQSAKAYWDKIK